MDARDLQDLVENWVKTLQPYSKEVWEMLVRGMVIEAHAQTAICALLVMIVSGLTMWAFRHDFDDSEAELFCRALPVIALIGCTVALMVNGYQSIVAGVAPDYFVLRGLVK